MKKPDRGPNYRQQIGAVELREIKRPDLVKDPYRIRGRYTKEDGRPGTFDAMNWRDARDRAAKINQDLEEGRAARSKSPTFAKVWKEWYAMREEDRADGPLSPATLIADELAGRRLVEELGRKPVDSILPIDAERFLKRLATRYPARALTCKTQLRQVFHFARRKKYVPFNQFLEDPIKLAPRTPERPWVPDWDAIERLIERVQGAKPPDPSRLTWSNMRAGLALSGGAGLRIGELVVLPWGQPSTPVIDKDKPCVDFEDGVIRVRQALSSRGIDLPKKKKIRDVPMTQWVYEALLDHMYLLKRLGLKPEGYLIRNRRKHGKPCFTDNFGSISFKKFLVSADVLESIDQKTEWRWHVLRRFYISARFALGHPHLEIMEAVAHEDLKVTLKHYARALPEPPPIWRHRFEPADPTSRVIDGTAATVDMVALPPPAPGSTDAMPAFVREAYALLQHGWKLRDVVRHVHKHRQEITRQFKRWGLPNPAEVYRQAIHKRYEQLYNESRGPREAADLTGTDPATYCRWRELHEAGVCNTVKPLAELGNSRRKRGSVTTDRQQKQLPFL